MSMTSTIPNEAMDIVSNLAGHPISLYLHISGGALLFVDWLSTLDAEIAYEWSGPWNAGRVFYFLTRYSSFLGTPLWLYCNIAFAVPPSVCSRIYVVCSAIWIFGVIIAELIMTVRVYALWGRKRSVGILLLTMTILDIAVSIVMFNLFRVKLQYFTVPNIPGCLSFTLGRSRSHSWPYIPIIVHQTLIFSLTVIKAVGHYRDKIYGTSLINTFYRDGIVYYALLVAFSIGNLAATHERSDMTRLYFLTFLQEVIHSILSSRMLLHLRRESFFHVDSKKSTSLDFATMERPEVSEPSVMATQSRVSERPEIPTRGRFRRDESPPQASGSGLRDGV
ncbi:hypothetical protein BDZ94DRAFT_388112 [Collybia nuda]|uniref:DUF6533 domain-containing protein n=1 Tax=Collybia nuda TaxID=64659 RepID=A0A9P6CKF0_9AGAR|nr:hypothetical protein BDZ94DRAFT_388112 [Collybia nuda]